MYSASKRILAAFILCSHILTSCFNPALDQEPIAQQKIQAADKPLVSDTIPTNRIIQAARAREEDQSMERASYQEATMRQELSSIHAASIEDPRGKASKELAATITHDSAPLSKLTSLTSIKAIASSQAKSLQERKWIEKELLQKEYVLKNGQKVSFYQEAGQLKASAYDQVGNFKRTLQLPVYLGKIDQAKPLQLRDIQVITPEKDRDKQGYVAIDQGGLMGGMISNNNNVRQSKENTGYDFFISHKQSTGGHFAGNLKHELLDLHPGLHIFLDVDDRNAVQNLEENIKRSKNIILLLTDDLLESKWVCKEIEWAVEANKNIITVWDKEKHPDFWNNCEKHAGYKNVKIKQALTKKAIMWYSELAHRKVCVQEILQTSGYHTNQKDQIKELPVSLVSQVSQVTINALVKEARNGNKEAIMRLLDASHVSHAYVQLVLGKLYQEGVGVSKDLRQAFAFYELSANQGNAEAQNNLGVMYYYGHGVSKDYKKAVYWYEKAANQGVAATQYNLGVMYQNGYGVPQDYTTAVEWFEKAAEQGYADAQYNLGGMYENGHGVSQDYKTAVEWYEKAAIQGVAAALDNLGDIYKKGYGVPQDYKKAVYWYERAAYQGYAYAQYSLGDMYKKGYGVSQDYKKAVEWYEKAANQGFAAAQDNLGDMYKKGYGVSQDYKKAVEWYEKAAKQGYADAQYNLGGMYENGHGGGVKSRGTKTYAKDY
jgi:uncharacterized protein